MKTVLKSFTAVAALAGAALIASGANAAPLASNIGSGSMGGFTSGSFSEYQFDVTGIYSMDLVGDADNEVYTVNLGSGAHITGIGWDVDLYADSPSWLSEIAVQFSSTDTLNWVSLNPAVGDAFSGSGSYSSGGVVDLVGLGYDFYLESDGLLRLEFFEGFDDYADDWDGLWESGFLTIQYDGGSTQPGVPEPASWMMMIGGLGLVGAAMRRSRASAKVSFA